jgi:hypothetical protein
MWYCELTYVSIQHILQRKWYSLQTLHIFIGKGPMSYEKRLHGSLSDFLAVQLVKYV